MIISPNEISGLQLWFDASDTTTITKDSLNTVSGWANKATQGTRSGYSAGMYTQSWRPHFETSATGNYLSFRGVNDFLTVGGSGAGTAETAFNSNLDHILQFVVVKDSWSSKVNYFIGDFTTYGTGGSSIYGPQGYCLDTSTSRKIRGRYITQGYWSGSTFKPNYDITTSKTMPTERCILGQCINRGVEHQVRCDGVKIGTKTLDASEATLTGFNQRPYTIGAQLGGSGEVYYHADSHMSEILLYKRDTPFTETEILDIEEYLRTKWSTPSPPPPSPSPTPTKTPTPTPTSNPPPQTTPTNTPLPPPTPPNVFDVFKKGNEDGFTRFKRMRLLGYV